MNMNLFASARGDISWKKELSPGAVVLRGFASTDEAVLLAALNGVIALAPFRHMITPGGYRMSVAMTNCGSFGWVTDRTGYRYDAIDPESGHPWPQMPDSFLNHRYEPGARLSLHQDKNERDFGKPIVSVSLGISAVFLFGGSKRADKPRRIPVTHGDVMVWGGPARLHYHGVMPLKEGYHPFVGRYRLNLTFRKAA